MKVVREEELMHIERIFSKTQHFCRPTSSKQLSFPRIVSSWLKDDEKVIVERLAMVHARVSK